MASSAPKVVYDHVRTKEDCDNYVNTVLAALALINVFRWNEADRKLDPDAKFGVGRRMSTSDKNQVSPSTDVTPDVVLQRKDNGVVGEITNSLTENDSYWSEKLKQVLKYDDVVTGWWTEDEKLSTHDIAFVVPHSRAVRVSDILTKEQAEEKGTIKFNRPTAVIGFHRHSGAAKEFVNLMRFFGSLSDADLAERLRHGIAVPQDILIVEYGDRKFVDFEPPMAYVLQVMWDNLFPSYLSDFPLDEGTKGHTPLTLSLERVFQDLQNNFGFNVEDARSTAVPERAWIKKALDHLVVFGMASQDDDKTYTIRYKALRGDHLQRFGELIQRNSGKLALLASKVQPKLFPEMEKADKVAPVSEVKSDATPTPVNVEATPKEATETALKPNALK